MQDTSSKGKLNWPWQILNVKSKKFAYLWKIDQGESLHIVRSLPFWSPVFAYRVRRCSIMINTGTQRYKSPAVTFVSATHRLCDLQTTEIYSSQCWGIWGRFCGCCESALLSSHKAGAEPSVWGPLQFRKSVSTLTVRSY